MSTKDVVLNIDTGLAEEEAEERGFFEKVSDKVASKKKQVQSGMPSDPDSAYIELWKIYGGT